MDAEFLGYLTPGREYQTLPGTVTLGAGIYTVLVPVTPNEIHAVEPTSTVRVDLAPGDGYSVADANPGAATLRINNTDTWTATLGDGINYDLLTASPDGTQNLQQVTLSFPHPAGESFTVKITSSDTTEDDLWDPAIPGTTGTPSTLVLGTDASGNVLDSYTFTTDPNAQSKTFLVGATQGDTRMFVLQYYFNGMENTDTCTPTFLEEQQSGQLGPNELAKPATTRSNDSENLGVSIKVNSPPNNDPTANGVDKPHNWLVGQMANLTATVSGPAQLTHKLTYDWDIPGNFKGSYDDKGTSAKTVDAQTYGFANAGQPVPLSFFWVSTDYDPVTVAGPDKNTVKLSIESWDRTATATASTLFKLYSSVAIDLTIVKGVVRFNNAASDDGVYRSAGLYSDTNVPNPFRVDPNDKRPLLDGYGIIHGAKVGTPQPVGNNACFAQGSFKFIQLMKMDESYTINGIKTPEKQNGVFLIDGINKVQNNKKVFVIGDPYIAVQKPRSGQPEIYSVSPDNPTNDGYVTDKNDVFIADAPAHALEGLQQGFIGDFRPMLSQIVTDDVFRTCIMYRPPGTGSQWVPLMMDEWTLKYQVDRITPKPLPLNGGSYNVHLWTITAGAGAPAPSTFVRLSKEPEWTVAYDPSMLPIK